MDNNELDKILKQKLKDQIKPSKELESKIKQKVEEEKLKKLKSMNIETTNQKHKYGKMKALISMAAIVLIALVVGGNLNNFTQNTTTIAVIKSVEPTKSLNGIVQNDSEFLIYAEDTNLETVQKSLYIEPALEYVIKEESNNVYKLTFKQNIPDNTIVKLQYVKNKITEDSWAYQTSNKLSVSSTYPANNESYVSQNTVIDVKLSYANVENFEENVKITPSIDGKWENLGNVWRFTPSKELEEQKYTIKINKGIKVQEQTLEEDYIFSFKVGKTFEKTKYSHILTTLDEIENCKTDELLKIYYETNIYVESDEEISKIEISKFAKIEQFKEYLKDKNFENAEKIGNYEFTKFENYLQLNKTLQTGYYVASVKNQNNKEIFNCPIQINELSAYAVQTERDIIVWVAKDKDLAENVSVQYLEQETKTNKDGIAEFKDVLDGTKIIKYVTIGNDQDKLLVGIYNYEQNNYPSGYIYTDRPLYKNTDTINIWGFVPRKLFYDKIEENSFYIQLGNEEKEQIKIDESGSFNYKIDLNNYIDTQYTGLKLYYKDCQLAYREISIRKYELQNYIYNVMIDRNYGYEGEEFNFEVKVEHITGLFVPNKTVEVRYNDNIYREITNENGIAKFTIKLINVNQENTAPMYSEIAIYNGDSIEYTDSSEYVPIYVLNSKSYAKIKTEDNKKYELTLYKLNTGKNVTVRYNLEEIYEGKYNTDIKINLIETVMEKTISSYTYNNYTKENEPNYAWIKTAENVKNIKTIPTSDGRIEIDTNKLEFKENTDNLGYHYEIEFVYKDEENKEIKEKQYINMYDEYSNDTLGYTYFIENNGCGFGDLPVPINYGYYTYRYLLKKDIDIFSVGETVRFTLAESTLAGIKDINNNGKILRLVLKENIIQKDVIEDDDLNYTFTEEEFPGCGITSAYFYDGKFYRMPVYYFDYKEEDRKVDVEIIADKEEYKPGDKVTLTVKTTNNSNPIKSIVNISVINKAIFELMEDSTSILYNIYENKLYNVYTYSTYKDYFEGYASGEGGGIGSPRGNFGDTAHFETIETDENGIATVSFTLPDNVTTYTVTAHSVNEDLYAGVNKIDIVSKLDFFIQSTEPRNVKVTDDLVLNATAIAEENYNVKYEFKIKELDKVLTTEANTNSIATVNFGKIPFGTYHAIIKAQYGEHEDGIEYEFNIIESAQEVKEKQTVKIQDKTQIEPTRNPIVLEIYNENMENYVKYIEFIEKTLNERLDTQIAYNQMQNIKNKYYNTQNSINNIKIEDYFNENGFKILRNSESDLVLTALISKYANNYYAGVANNRININKILSNTNIFEIYLLAAANKEPVLNDLLYLKEENDISNYNKLLVTLSLEFLGDYQNAKELYNSIKFVENEVNEYKSIIALIDTYINKQEAVNKINELIEERPEDEYLRFAILSFFENNSVEIEKKETVKIVSENINETIEINSLEVKTYILNNQDLKTIKFETDSKDICVSYYYQTLLDNIESKDISKDIKINLNGEFKKGNIVTLSVEFNNDIEGEVRIALPNSLRLILDNYDYRQYYLMSNQIDYATFYKTKNCTKMDIPLIVSIDGEYKFENIVCNYNGIYHISNSLDFTITK